MNYEVYVISHKREKNIPQIIETLGFEPTFVVGTGEKEIYERVMRGAKAKGFELKEVEAMKIAHIVDGALEDEPPEAASINIKVTIHLRRPIKIEVEVSL